MSDNDLLNVSEEFPNQNLVHKNMKKSRNRGGPYSKNDKDIRMNEVYR